MTEIIYNIYFMFAKILIYYVPCIAMIVTAFYLTKIIKLLKIERKKMDK